MTKTTGRIGEFFDGLLEDVDANIGKLDKWLQEPDNIHKALLGVSGTLVAASVGAEVAAYAKRSNETITGMPSRTALHAVAALSLVGAGYVLEASGYTRCVSERGLDLPSI